MILEIGFNERRADFPSQPVVMREVCTPALRAQYMSLFNATAVEYCGRGFNNSHHRLRGVPAHTDLIVRRVLAPVPALADRLKREYRVLEHLTQCGYPHAPTPVCWIPPDAIDGAPAYAMTFVPGAGIHFNPTTVRNLAQTIGQLHRLPVPDWLAQTATTTPADILAAMCANFNHTLAAVHHGMSPETQEKAARLIGELHRRLQNVDWSDATTALLHGDLGEHNTLMTQPGHLVLIDWEFAAVSDPTLDLMWLFGRDGFDALKRSHFLDAYQTVYGNIPSTWSARLPLLTDFSIFEMILWAQGCLNDIQEGRNSHYYSSADLTYLTRQVSRIKTLVP